MPGLGSEHLPEVQLGIGLPSAIRLVGTAMVTRVKTTNSHRRFFFTVSYPLSKVEITVIMCYLTREQQITSVTVTHPGTVDLWPYSQSSRISVIEV